MAKAKKVIDVLNEKSSFWSSKESLSADNLSVHRDLKSDVPEYIDAADFAKFRIYSHALEIAEQKKLINPMSDFVNSHKAGAYNEMSDKDINELRRKWANKAKLWGELRLMSLLQLCLLTINVLDVNNVDDKEVYDSLHSTFYDVTGFDFNEIYLYMNNLSRRILLAPDFSEFSDSDSDKSQWEYGDWINLAIKDCWGSSEGIDLLTLYSKVEKMLPSVRTDTFFESYINK